MIQLLANKSPSGDLYITLAGRYLADHEWGEAKKVIEQAITKGRLSDPDKAYKLLQVVCTRLGKKCGRKAEKVSITENIL